MIPGLVRHAYQANTEAFPLFFFFSSRHVVEYLKKKQKHKRMIKNSFCLAKFQFQSHFLASEGHCNRILV